MGQEGSGEGGVGGCSDGGPSGLTAQGPEEACSLLSWAASRAGHGSPPAKPAHAAESHVLCCPRGRQSEQKRVSEVPRI